MELNDIGSSLVGKITLIFLASFRLFLGSIVLTVINMINMFELKNRFNNNEQPDLIHKSPFNNSSELFSNLESVLTKQKLIND